MAAKKKRFRQYLYVTWESGKTTKSQKAYTTQASMLEAIDYLRDNFPYSIRVIESNER